MADRCAGRQGVGQCSGGSIYIGARVAVRAEGSIWILACGAGGALRDVTRRYATRWSGVCSARGSLGRAWDVAVARHANTNEDVDTNSPGSIAASLELARADLLDEESMAKQTRREPIPTSKAAFKRHASYVLNSQLRTQDIIHPPEAKPVGLFRGVEKVWRRSDVAELRTPTQWRRLGRCVREDERPVKTLRGGQAKVSELFGAWQTELAPEMPAESVAREDVGFTPIPGTNNFGNIELLDADSVARLPPDTVYLDDNLARSAAARLGIFFAPAVVGFTRESGLPKPRLSGAVIWQRDAEAVLQAVAVERERQQIEEDRKRRERFKSAWRMLIKNVLVDLYVEDRHRGAIGSIDLATHQQDAPANFQKQSSITHEDLL